MILNISTIIYIITILVVSSWQDYYFLKQITVLQGFKR